MNAFSSKYDAYLAGRARLTQQEQLGLQLFEDKAKCANCHPSQSGPRGEPPLFTDYTFDNIGVPPNPLNPWYAQLEFNPLGRAWTDYGLGAFSSAERGRSRGGGLSLYAGACDFPSCPSAP